MYNTVPRCGMLAWVLKVLAGPDVLALLRVLLMRGLQGYEVHVCRHSTTTGVSIL